MSASKQEPHMPHLPLAASVHLSQPAPVAWRGWVYDAAELCGLAVFVIALALVAKWAGA